MEKGKLLKLRWALGIGLMTVLVVSLFLVSGCVPTAQPAEAKVFKFGNFTSFSGGGAPWGWQIHDSFLIAEEDINAAGGIKVGGKYYQIEVVPYDNQMDPSLSTSVTRKAIYDDGIKYMQIMSTDAAAAVMELTRQEKCLVITCSPFRNYIGAEYPQVFQTYHDQIDCDVPKMTYISQAYPEYKNVAVVSCDDLKGREWVEDFQQTIPPIGFTIVDITYWEIGTKDYYSMLTSLLTKDIDVIALGPCPGEDIAYIIKQARELGYEKLFVCPGIEKELRSICGMELLEGTIGLSEEPTFETDVGKSWAERYIERQGSMEYWTSFCGYDTLMLLKTAIEKADTFDTDAVIDALGTVSYDGVLGPISFRANRFSDGLPRMINMKFFIVEVQNGEEVVVYSGYAVSPE